MKEILIKRVYQNFGMMNHKVVLGNGTQHLLGNGETIRVKPDQLPIKAYVKQGWLRSRDFIIDDSTTKLIVKNDVSKNLIAPGLPILAFLSTFLPTTIIGSHEFVQGIRLVCISLVLLWAIYVFIIKRKDWVLIEDKSSEIVSNGS